MSVMSEISFNNTRTTTCRLYLQVGPVSLVIFMKWPEAALKSALRMEADEEAFTKRMEEFNKHVLPLTRHKHSFTVRLEDAIGEKVCVLTSMIFIILTPVYKFPRVHTNFQIKVGVYAYDSSNRKMKLWFLH